MSLAPPHGASVSEESIAPPLADLRWFDIAATETVDHPGLITNILEKQADGMTVRGVFPREAVAKALAYFQDVPDAWHDHHFGAMLGRPLNLGGAESQDRTPFLDDADRCRPLYREAFGFDPHERLAEILAPMLGDLVVGTPEEGGRRYNPGNVRRYDPGKGGLQVHAGNDFMALVGDGAMSHIKHTTRVMDHLSYFVVLQPPEQGGALSVFDRLWTAGRPDVREVDLSSVEPDESYVGGFSNDPGFEHIPRIELRPAAGDLILFGGGWRWHRVDPIGGAVSRITYGGFAAPSVVGRTLHFWC